MNKQNKHIAQKLNDAQAAVKVLMRKDFTIAHIDVEGVRPCIKLLSAPNTKRPLPLSWKITKRATAGRDVEIAACVEGCDVRWLEQTQTYQGARS